MNTISRLLIKVGYGTLTLICAAIILLTNLSPELKACIFGIMGVSVSTNNSLTDQRAIIRSAMIWFLFSIWMILESAFALISGNRDALLLNFLFMGIGAFTAVLLALSYQEK